MYLTCRNPNTGVSSASPSAGLNTARHRHVNLRRGLSKTKTLLYRMEFYRGSLVGVDSRRFLQFNRIFWVFTGKGGTRPVCDFFFAYFSLFFFRVFFPDFSSLSNLFAIDFHFPAVNP